MRVYITLGLIAVACGCAHPSSEAKTAPEGAVEFAAHFPKPGIYKAWGQIQRDGSVFTVPFVMDHKGGQPMSHAQEI